MKRALLVTSSVLVIILALAWFVPHSLFSVALVPPATQADTSTVAAAMDPAAVTPGQPTPTEAAPTEIAQVTPSAEPPYAPTLPPQEAFQGLRAAFGNVSLVVPDGLASSVQGAVLPAEDGMLIAPDGIEFTLDGYPSTGPDSGYRPRVRIYPAAEYVQKNMWAAEAAARLQVLLANPDQALNVETLPALPYMGSAGRLYAAQPERMAFQSGSGVRMVSSHAQYPAPVSKYGSIYHYEGLTNDGKYLVLVEMPLVLPAFADESNPGQNGITYLRQDWSLMGPYYQAITGLLDQTSPNAFTPMLGKLDALVQSIRVEGTPAAAAANAPCLAPAPGTSLLTNAANGYCVLVPDQFSTKTTNLVVINPNTSTGGDQPGDAWLLTRVEDAAGRDAGQVAADRIASVGSGFNITHFEMGVDGGKAIVVDGLPGQNGNRMVFIVHHGRLYTLEFDQWTTTSMVNGMGQYTPIERLFKIVMATMRFLQ